MHALVLALLYLGGHFSWPAPPIPIEIQPLHRTVKQIGPERRGDPNQPPPRRETAHVPGAGTHPKQPAKLPPPSTEDLKPYAPDDANLVVLLRSDKLRKSPYRRETELLLSALPDYSTLLGGTGLSPIEDFEALLIATANPRDVTATFLAARFRESAKIRAIGDKPLQPGDPRVFRFPAPGLAVLLHPDEALKLDEAGDAGAADPRARWLKQLEQFDQAAQSANGPAVLVTLSDVPSLMHFQGGLPTPLALALAVTAEASPSLTLKAVFESEADAEQLEREWPNVMQRFRSMAAIVMLSTALDDLQLERHGQELELKGHIPEQQMRRAMSLLISFLPHAPPVDGGQ